ncbi:MAG: CopD family protein, partial [Pseudomonadota bacterium]
MEGIADFLDSLLGGVDLIAYSFAIGSVLWGVLVLRPWRQGNGMQAVIKNSIALLYKGAFALAGIQFAKIVVKVWLMAATLDASPFPAFLHTIQFQAGTWRIVLALAVAMYTFGSLRIHPQSLRHWLVTGLLTIPLIICGAWLVHGAGRFDDRAQLMALTVVHQVGAAMWIGGIGQLLSLWLLKLRNAIPASIWPESLRRFSRVGFTTVALLLATGIPMAFKYISSWNGFIGTGYGNLLLVKMLLLAIALGFAYVNFKAVREFNAAGGGVGGVTSRV